MYKKYKQNSLAAITTSEFGPFSWSARLNASLIKSFKTENFHKNQIRNKILNIVLFKNNNSTPVTII